MKTARVLVVDDESSLRTSLFRILDRKNYQVVTASRIEEAKTFAPPENPFDLAIIDLNLPDGSGLELMKWLKESQPLCEVIILTGEASLENAIQSTKAGAFHFLTKPFSMEEMNSISEKALAHKNLRSENLNLRTQLGRKSRFDQIIGESQGVTELLDMVHRVADTDSTVLIHGESGTGKELIARSLHQNSSRASQPFVAINCGAIPAELLESELFGHVKGAFTGAIVSRIGRFEMADGGTLFLDEIGDTSPVLQVKLLRVLQERSFEPVGGAKSIQVNVRVIAATNKNLEDEVEAGRFREDLFYRLNVIPLNVLPLRERKTDIALLVSHFLNQYNSSKGRKLEAFSPEALQCLYEYPWPGNIRELENLVERMTIIKGSGVVSQEDLPIKYRGSARAETLAMDINQVSEDLDFNSAVDHFENQLILRALEKTGWNRNQAAALLRLNRTTLVEKIKKKGLRRPGDTGLEI
jgi:DNA-binding NtrC family response regulator